MNHSSSRDVPRSLLAKMSSNVFTVFISDASLAVARGCANEKRMGERVAGERRRAFVARACAMMTLGLTSTTEARVDGVTPMARNAFDQGDSLANAERVAAILKDDLERRRYFFTGALTRDVFADDCRFIDPTTDVKGVTRYINAIQSLFDDERSTIEATESAHVTSATTIECDYVASGTLKFPWTPKIAPYEGHVIWTIAQGGVNDGKIIEQRQTWSVSAGEALMESFVPGFVR